MSATTHDFLTWLLICVMIILMAGEPDLLDAIIDWINRAK